MKIRVEFFKPTGKWYAGGEVEVGDVRLWQGQQVLLNAIWQNQQIIHADVNSRAFWTVVSMDTPENDASRDHDTMNMAVLQVGRDSKHAEDK